MSMTETAGRPAGGTADGPAVEVADLAKQEYYYDLSAGIEVSLRKALRQANRRAAQRLRDHRGVTLHLACVVVVNNEIYGARIGSAQVFLVRRARLFLPGDEPGEPGTGRAAAPSDRADDEGDLEIDEDFLRRIREA